MSKPTIIALLCTAVLLSMGHANAEPTKLIDCATATPIAKKIYQRAYDLVNANTSPISQTLETSIASLEAITTATEKCAPIGKYVSGLNTALQKAVKEENSFVVNVGGGAYRTEFPWNRSVNPATGGSFSGEIKGTNNDLFQNGLPQELLQGPIKFQQTIRSE
ncbi:hypothetical protein [Pseudomonas solani]|uniref:hypothetical protein n=1 Tax=Pseudomonas solani TaxID=2731552 RepID=UPI003D6C5288